jgi:WD40 repeat protein
MNEAAVGTRPSPYKGLAAFDDSDLDALFFFGRERDTETIAANLMASRFTVLYGPLGVGKSSVLRAGVVRRLRSLADDAAVVVHDSWAGNPARELVLAAAEGLGLEAPDADVPLADAMAEMASRFGSDVYLVLDQFEELFVYSGAEAFAGELAQVVTTPELRVNVLLALREDALSELDVFTGRIPNVFRNYLSLERLDRAAGRAAVVGPLARYNEVSERSVEIEPELVDAVLDEVQIGRVHLGGPPRGPAEPAEAGRIEAAYLQLVMQRLWDAEGEAGSTVLRRSTFQALGGAEAIVRAHLDEAMEALPPEQRDVAARVFNHLVTPSGTKIAHGVTDLARYAGVPEGELGSVMASLGGNRILRPVDGRYEIFHDVLAKAVLAWRTRHEAERALERERAQANRRHRRLLALLVASAVAVAAMTAVTIYALTQRSEAREQTDVARAEALRARASALNAEAGVLIPVAPAEVDPELGLLLAAEAARLSPTSRVADTLRRALLVSHLRAVLPERRVTTASFSPDGARVVVGTAGGSVHVYATGARTRVTAFQADGAVAGASFAPDGSILLTTETGHPARTWDAVDGTALRSFGRAPTAASFSPDGSLVLTVEPDGARTWSAADGSEVTAFRQPETVRQASFGPGGRLVATVAGEIARVFDARTGRRVAAVDQEGEITSATITPDGRRLVTTGENKTARLWMLHGGGRLVRELSGHNGELTAGAVPRDGGLLVTTSTDTTARVWALSSGALIADLVGHNNRVTGVAFSPDGLSFVTWSVDGTARVWDRGRPAARLVLAGHGDAVTSASFDRSGDTVLTTSANGRARIWRSHVDAELERLAEVPTPIAAAAFSADGSVAAIAGRSGIEVLSAADGDRVGVLPASRVRALAVSRDGSFVAAAQASGISVWELATNEPVGTTAEPEQSTALAFSADDRRLAIGTGAGTIRIWTPSEDRLAALAEAGGRVTSVAFSPQGDRLAAGFGNGTLEVWSVRDGRRLSQRLEHRRASPVSSIAFSRGGRQLVTAGADTTVRVWNAANGRESYSLRGHSTSVSDAAFSPNGQWIVSAGRAIVGLWDLASRQRLLFLRGHAGSVLAASFDPTGRTISTVGADGTLRAYSCEICGGIPELLRLAERRLAATSRELTPAERRRYLDRD